ncbi:YbaB/EbfC family nucleoid-associated protein [Amycolatopsis sp. NPDC059021]|uniref:YbaB/EbfC family nucleoid-associated protein n=1 Tax=Amycolatopsis sp. NPDC059021 TaxID=3346704 RepID=UPI00366E0A2E
MSEAGREAARHLEEAREAMVTALNTLSADVTSPGGVVSLSVNTDGVMTRLRLSDAVTGMSEAEIADLVMRTYAKAQRQSAERSAELLRPLGNAGYLTDRLRWRLQFEPTMQAAEEPPRTDRPQRVKQEGHYEYLKDRSDNVGRPAAEKAEARPVSDDEWYDKGMRFDPAW